ncbi:winged helix-turn-helix domain-containing protein [Enterovirga sp. CN4-39]|uniref:winged helix-turn-helix domain-containing protein n=1 Tax=Enterovirga sp. CN4-39 TaxID=3400910 RepID=UPI003C1182B9
MQELVRRSAAGVDKDARQSASQAEQVGSVSPEGVRLSLRGNIIRGPAQRDVLLTTAENRLLRTLAMRPWCVLSRAELGTAIYGAQQPANDRAVDVLVTRLRKKLMLAGGEAARALVKTEFRFGYSWTADALADSESELQLRQGRAEMSVSQDPPPPAVRWAAR